MIGTSTCRSFAQSGHLLSCEEMTSESQPELSFSLVPGSESPPWAVQVADWLGPEGHLQRVEPDFRPRPGQLRLALAVGQCVAEGGVLVAEAGTGVGKTYGYLLPALLSGRRTLMATTSGMPNCATWPRSSAGLIRRAPATWPSCLSWTRPRPCCP